MYNGLHQSNITPTLHKAQTEIHRIYQKWFTLQKMFTWCKIWSTSRSV